MAFSFLFFLRQVNRYRACVPSPGLDAPPMILQCYDKPESHYSRHLPITRPLPFGLKWSISASVRLNPETLTFREEQFVYFWRQQFSSLPLQPISSSTITGLLVTLHRIWSRAMVWAPSMLHCGEWKVITAVVALSTSTDRTNGLGTAGIRKDGLEFFQVSLFTILLIFWSLFATH